MNEVLAHVALGRCQVGVGTVLGMTQRVDSNRRLPGQLRHWPRGEGANEASGFGKAHGR